MNFLRKAKLLNEPQSVLSEEIPIVDLFAGPGGLGEGFSSVEGDPFRIIVSAEMNSSARATLRLRAFYRLLKRRGGNALDSYYRYCNGESEVPFDETNRTVWDESGEEARQIELGTARGNDELDVRISSRRLGPESPWVLIGGPPCQAYSVVGRARNRGKVEYKAEEDHRHFLYKEYLRIIEKYRPAVFVMENVKGILTASVGGKKIFHSILTDLSGCGNGYRIHSMSRPTSFCPGDDPSKTDVHDFVIKAEEHGIPQARHRVILVGVRADISRVPGQLERLKGPSVHEILGSLPRVRSGLTKDRDNDNDPDERWGEVVAAHFTRMAREVENVEAHRELHAELRDAAGNISRGLGTGALRLDCQSNDGNSSEVLGGWYHDARLSVWLNHEARGHMSSDLQRYAYASAYAKAYERSPKGHDEFDLEGLRPNHENWETGKFSDRFRVQAGHRVSTTITSHISKDGHYFIHYDPRQCRSLTVREAARLQTFPDNYFFQGNRTEQFHQVGNAVPPLLAKKIADLVNALLQAERTGAPTDVSLQRDQRVVQTNFSFTTQTENCTTL
jgi:DNA (cytosine-5)-methyltransferase 1